MDLQYLLSLSAVVSSTASASRNEFYANYWAKAAEAVRAGMSLELGCSLPSDNYPYANVFLVGHSSALVKENTVLDAIPAAANAPM